MVVYLYVKLFLLYEASQDLKLRATTKFFKVFLLYL